jgi:RHS repeat-associated protein
MGDLYECVGNSTADGTINCNQQRYKIYAGGKLVTEVTRDSFNNETTKYIHTDHLGSSTLITSDIGAVLEDRKFSAFGTPNADLSTSSIHSGYTGQEHDSELGLINMKGRLYDANIRRFITPDPFVTRALDTQGLNHYSYVQNNPLNLVDPSGFDECQPYTYPTDGGDITVYPTNCGPSQQQIQQLQQPPIEQQQQQTGNDQGQIASQMATAEANAKALADAQNAPFNQPTLPQIPPPQVPNAATPPGDPSRVGDGSASSPTIARRG